jgi:peptidoglycan/xylan/chitin deacetylase (PgdA/CDA1 family)
MAAIAGLARVLANLGDAVRGPRVSVLIFHRVLPSPDELFPEEPCAARFEALVGLLASSFTLLTVRDAHARWTAGALPRRAAVITFDDGYADNATVALPILQRHGAPATFFVSSGFLDGGRMWNDTVIESLRRTTLAAVDLGFLGLGVLPLPDAAARRRAIDVALPRIKYLSLQAREPVLRHLHEACGAPALPDDLMMTSAQVRGLHAAGMEIGAHTVMHPILAATDDAEAERELRAGRDRLQQIVGAPVDVLAYPNGKPGKDYDHRHVRMARELGFKCAVSTSPGVVSAGADALQWPRFTPWDREPWAWMSRLLGARYSSGPGTRASMPVRSPA